MSNKTSLKNPSTDKKTKQKVRVSANFLSFRSDETSSQPQLTNLENFVRSQSVFLSVTGRLEEIGNSGNQNYNQQNQVSSSTNNSKNY